jgi:hypothetical protein
VLGVTQVGNAVRVLVSLAFFGLPVPVRAQTLIQPNLEQLTLVHSPFWVYELPTPTPPANGLFNNPFGTTRSISEEYSSDEHTKIADRADAVCSAENLHAKACRYHFRAAFLESAAFLAIEIGGYLKVDEASGTVKQLEYDIDHGVFWKMYVQTLENFRYNHFNDDDAWTTTWIGHPMSGSFVEFIWIQNDPKSRGLRLSKSWPYWRSRLMAMIPSAIYSAQWLVGPVSESSIGNQGCCGYWITNGHTWTNGTGYVDFVVTPTAGLLWSVGEDWIDIHLFERVRARTNNPLLLFGASFMVPTKSGANILRFKAPWYRDPPLE